ncbi:hypothetical protein CRG98_008006 [Punica granatum]|uniref:Uncharacterized protein n=1 Tax=Punica granatum TaxID=22663 RepID=A0A2I0KT07_PUNGR|nr:hypothetical protein CRG98_008006 [Punica granatum]
MEVVVVDSLPQVAAEEEEEKGYVRQLGSVPQGWPFLVVRPPEEVQARADCSFSCSWGRRLNPHVVDGDNNSCTLIENCNSRLVGAHETLPVTTVMSGVVYGSATTPI